MSYSLYNPFLFSAFLDRRTFKNDEPSSNNDDNNDSPAPATTNQDRINEIYASSDNPWETNGAELNALTQDRSGIYSGGSTAASSSSSSSSSSSQSQPSAGPTPTVIPTGTTLKTGTVLNNDDDPVVFTPKDGGGFTGQNQSTLPAAEPETFGEAFAANRAAGNETFTYNGNLYTTDLAPETPATPSFSYDAFGNAYDTPAAAAQADQVAEAQAAAAQNAITAASNAALDPRGDQIQSPTSNGAGIASLGEDDVMSQPVVGAAGQEYADSLPGFSYDFTAGDAATGGGRDVDADLGTGMSSATVSAADLAAFNADPFGGSYGDGIRSGGPSNIAAIPLDGGGNLLVNDSSNIYDKINADAAAAVDSRSVFEKAKDAFFDDRNVFDRAVSDSASNLLNASGAVNAYGSPLPDDNVVADLSGYAGMSQNDFLEAAGSDVRVGKFYDAFGNEYSSNTAARLADITAAKAATPQTDYGFTDYMGDLYKSVVGGGYETAAGKTSGVATGLDLLYNSGVFDQLGQGVMVNSSIPGLNAQVQEKLAENNALAAANPRSPTASRDYVADTVASLRAKGGEYAASVTPEMIERIANAMPDMRPGKEGLDVLGRPYGYDKTATSLIAAGEAVDTLADIGIVAAGTATGMAPLAIGAVGATSFAEAGGAAADEVSQMIDQAAQLGQIKNADGSAVSTEQLAEIKRIAQGQAYTGAGGIAAFSDPLVAATLGTGKITQGILKTPFMVQQLAKMGITAGSEFGSGYGEQVATNIAGQGAGVDVGTTEGATGSGLLELTGGVGAGTVSTGVDTAGRLLSRGPDQVIAEQRQAAVLDPSKFPTSGQIADSSVQSSYDSVITPAPEELLAITDQTETASESRITAAEELMRSQIDQTGMIKPDAIAKVADQLGLTLFEASEAGNRAIEGKMNDDANSLRARAEQSVIDTGGIPAELNAEINDLLSENPDVAASIVDDAFNRPFVSNTGQSRLQMASDMDAAPVVDTAPVSQPTVMDVSPAQQAINYGAMQAQEAAYTAAKGATGDDAAAEAAGEAAYNNFLRNPSGLPEAPTEGIAPKVDTTSVGAASIAKAPASGIETVVAKSPDDIIADQRAANKTYSYRGTGAPQTYDEVVENAKSSAKNSQEVEDAYFEVFDANQGNLDLIEINRLAAEKTDPIIDRLVQEEIARDYTVVDNKMNADATTNTSLSTIPTRVVVGDSLEGYSAADVSGQPIGSSRPQDDLDVRNTTGLPPFTNMKNEPIGSIDDAPYGEPVRRVINNPDGTTTIQVGSRVSAEGAAGNRDNYVSAAVTLPASATDEQKAAAYREAEANWRSNYEGATTSGEIERNAGKVLPNEDITTFKAEEALTNKMDADNAAPVIKKKDVAAVVEVDNTAEDQAAADQTDDGVEVEIADDLFDAASKADQDVVTVNSDGTATVAVDPNAVSTGTDLVVVPETTTDVAVMDDKTTDVAVMDDKTTDVAVMDDKTTDVAVVPDTTTDLTVVPETTTTTDVAVDPTVDLVTYTDVEDDPVEVEVEDEVQEPGGDVTVDLDEDDTFVPVITTTDENGDTITECPEGYTMVEGPDGPMCQKSVSTVRQRAGAGTRAYTGLSGNIGRVGPGQKRRTSTTTERTRPTIRSA